MKIHNVSYDQGVYFLVSDCVVDENGENTNLYHYLQEIDDKLSEDEIFELLSQLASALDYAHQIKGGGQGIAHLGIKLNNILVGRGDQTLKLFLSDYGLSKVMGAGTFLTRTYQSIAETLGLSLQSGSIDAGQAAPLHRSFLQSYSFLAPEQKFPSAKIHHEYLSDQYAFGVLAYYLLMGALPEGYFEMPSGRNHYQYNWDLLICQCMANNPLKRPERLMPALERIQKIEAVTHRSVEKLIEASVKMSTSSEKLRKFEACTA